MKNTKIILFVVILGLFVGACASTATLESQPTPEPTVASAVEAPSLVSADIPTPPTCIPDPPSPVADPETLAAFSPDPE
ncbi:MAG: hypothetical protein HQ574_04305, partial [Chloroflexi bacterium]|nr:hypothetical protein [Chloroflexota bacterium]